MKGLLVAATARPGEAATAKLHSRSSASEQAAAAADASALRDQLKKQEALQQSEVKTDSAFAGPSLACTRGDVLCIQMPWHVQDEMASAIRDGVQELREKLKVAEAGLDDSQV